MTIKRKVDCRFLRQELVSKLWNIEQVFVFNSVEAGHAGFEFTITAGRDGKHRTGSKHYEDKAIDCRVWYTRNGRIIPLGDQLCEVIAKDLRDLLGKDYDIVVHYKDNGDVSHIHIEWDS